MANRCSAAEASMRARRCVEAATRELREKVQAQLALGRRVLIVPHLMSFGGIEQGVRKRLEGLEYTMSEQALMPDDRILQWVLASAR